MRKNKQEEPVAATPPAGDNTQVKLDYDKASQELESLVVPDDDPPPEPIERNRIRYLYPQLFQEEGAAKKCISVEVKGSDTDPVDIDITLGLTAGAILTALQLEDYVLCTAPNAHHGFAEDDEVFSQVNDRDTLYALTRIAVADNFMEYIAFGEGLL